MPKYRIEIENKGQNVRVKERQVEIKRKCGNIEYKPIIIENK